MNENDEFQSLNGEISSCKFLLPDDSRVNTRWQHGRKVRSYIVKGEEMAMDIPSMSCICSMDIVRKLRGRVDFS